MAYDINNFVIDRVVRGIALSQKDSSVLFSINQIQNPSLTCSSESADAVDAMGERPVYMVTCTTLSC